MLTGYVSILVRFEAAGSVGAKTMSVNNAAREMEAVPNLDRGLWIPFELNSRADNEY